MKEGIKYTWGFILESNQSYIAPVWLTEFGTNVDQFKGDDIFIDCVKTGSYYIRSGTIESHESFGLLTDNWNEIKLKSFIDILSTM
ncbi:unnamed protein product [Rotaria sordida]|uniref:Uncharacterized protein n=1 Tax=Rotaria sordida TaxID=392033 RepID=A0A814Z2N8_9BILA|nr:unnamed protein product [Rotaria sordida]CAF1236800.1 unnamed protein product [Rotaria sordida]CAF1244160.1 unnamed protein product [Rotaria sordida]